MEDEYTARRQANADGAMEELSIVSGGFKIGKTYRHTTGNTMTVVGAVNTYTYGPVLVAEDHDNGHLTPIGSDEDATLNWTEVKDRRDWMLPVT